MIGNFERCEPVELKIEGGFSDDPQDPGRVTNLGVTRETWEAWVGHPVTVDDMKALTPSDVDPLYHKDFWDAVEADQLDSGVDWMMFDASVNQGASRAARWLQAAVGATVDGIVGPQTVAAAHAVGAELVLARLYSKRAAAYRADPDFPHFGSGWLARLERVFNQAKAMASGQQVAA